MRTYSPKKVQVIIGNHITTGYAKGSFVVVEKKEDDFTVEVGSDGEGARTQSADESGSVTVTLMQTSASNDVFSGLRDADKASGAAVFPLMIKDGSGRTIVTAAEAWIRKVPNSDFSDAKTDRAWIFDSAILIHKVGGN